MIDWMSEMFGPYPFEAFGYVSITGLGASLETQTMVVLSENGIGDQAKLAHEMAHMWFGDWVSLDSWGEMWRSEGFATYIQNMWLTRDNPAALEDRINLLENQISQDPRDYPLNDPPPGELFGRDSYLKGAVLVHALRREIGDQAFFDGLQTYFQEYGGATASDAQFQAVMEESSGMSLEDFFASWFK
jgi:aminopeptidase N